MNSQPPFDEELLRRLPLPLAQLYQRAHYGKTPLEQYLTAYYLWEASLKLLGTAAIIEYVECGRHDPKLTDRLQNLARPALGHWWEFVRLLVPVLAEAGDADFAAVRDLVLGRIRDDMPRAAGLDVVLREVLDGTFGARATVRLSELIDRLIRHRNHELGHGAAGQRDSAFYSRMGRTLLAGAAEILGRCDVLAGRRLVLITDIRRQETGDWLMEWRELLGERARILDPLTVPKSAVAHLPLPGRLYLAAFRPPADGAPGQVGASATLPEGQAGMPVLRCLHPLVVYEAATDEIFFLNARRGRQRIEYLSYSSGRAIDREDWTGEQRALLGRVLDMPVESPQLEAWAARSQADEPAATATTAPPLMETPAPALRRLGDFEIVSKLGQGGMGVVYRAWQSSLGRHVALKALLRTGDAKSEARFSREIHALGRVEHPHLIKIFTSGADGDQWFYAMELIEGATLGAVCDKLQNRNSVAATLDLPSWQGALSTVCEESRKAETPLSECTDLRSSGVRRPTSTARESLTSRSYLQHVVELVHQVAQAAHALHEAGIVHRDIKPGNIMVNVEGKQAVLMDLGLAQLADEMDGKLTRTRQFVGTLRYASPEQVLAVNRVDRRSDVYSLGATLWELLTLRPLFGAGDQTPTPELMQRIQYEEPERMRKFNRRVGKDLDAIVLKCLEKDPKRRYATAQDLADDLQRFLTGETVQARPSRLRRNWRRLRRRPGLIAAVLAGLLLAAAAVFGLWYWDTHYRLKIDYYAQLVNRWGFPEGTGRLSAEQSRRRNHTFKFYRRGGRVERFDIINGHDQPTAQAVSFYIKHSSDSAGAQRECRLEYRRNEAGEITEEIAFDRTGEVIWTLHYITPTTAYYTDKRGFPRARTGSGAAYVEFVWSEEGFPKELRYLDKNGKPQPDVDGSFGERREYDLWGLPVETVNLGSDGIPGPLKDGRFKTRRSYDALGNVTELAYFGAKGQRILHPDGYAQYAATYDEHGNTISLAYFGTDGKPTLHRNGFAKLTFTHDDHGNRTEIAYHGLDTRPTLHKDGYARWKARHDERGNMVEKAFFGIEVQPALIQDGYAKWTAKYDERGDKVETAYFGVDGQATLHKDGFAKFIAKYDERGNKVEGAYFGVDGQPALHRDGDAKWTARYDERNNILETTNFGLNGSPTPHKDGYAKRKSRYDEHGNEIERVFFGVDDGLALFKDGYARWTARYEEHGNKIEMAYFGMDGQPAPHRDGNARWTARYDERGNKIEWAYFAVDGRPTTLKNGYHKAAFRYDEGGRVTETAYFDEMGRPAADRDGLTRWTRKYDSRGNRIEVSYFGPDGKLTLHKDGHAKLTSKYDGRSNEIERAYFGVDGRPTLHKEGNAKWKAEYDERGNKIEMAYFGLDDKLTLHKDGNAKWKAKYDQRGYQIELGYFGVDDRLKLLKNGYAKLTYKNDEQGRVIEMAFFGADDRPARHSHGYAKWLKKYEEGGRRVEQTYFGLDGRATRHREGYSKTVLKYDECGRQTETAFFDEAGRPVVDAERHARWTIRYDPRGNRIEEAYFGLDGRPTLRPGFGAAKFTSRYDERSNEFERTYFGVDGRPTLHQEGIVGWKARYDERGNKIEMAYFGLDGKLTLHKDGNAKWKAKYDERGNRIETTYFGPDDRPFSIKDGYATLIARYDERGYQIEEAYFDGASRPVAHKDGDAGWTAKHDVRGNRIEKTFRGYNGTQGYAQKTVRYDERGRVAEVAYLDKEGKPARQKDGNAKFTAKYDDRGNRIEESYFDEDGKPVPLKSGYAKLKMAYDDRGNEIERAFFDETDKRIRIKGGYAKWNVKFDSNKNEIERAYFDENDNPVTTTSGYARWTARYDQRGNRIESAYFAPDGRLCVLPGEIYARWLARYDQGNRAIDKSFFDQTGKLVKKSVAVLNVSGKLTSNDAMDRIRKSSVHKVHNLQLLAGKSYTIDLVSKDFDAYLRLEDATGTELAKDDDGGGNLNARLSFQPPRSESYRVIATTYQGGTGNYTLAVWDDGKGARAVSPVAKLDDRGNRIEEAYVDSAGKPARHKDGYLQWTAKYDVQNRPIEKTYRGYDGKKGYASMIVKYDHRGYVSEVAYLNNDGKPARHTDGNARFMARYDDRGNRIEESYFDEGGKPINIKSGYARWTATYDERGNKVDVAYFDVLGKAPRIRVVVTEVLADSQAARLGLKTGDILVTYDGKEVRNTFHFIHGRRSERAGDAARTLHVLRSEQMLPFQVHAGQLGLVLENRVLAEPTKVNP